VTGRPKSGVAVRELERAALRRRFARGPDFRAAWQVLGIPLLEEFLETARRDDDEQLAIGLVVKAVRLPGTHRDERARPALEGLERAGLAVG
jgi:hypothetical protein